MPHGNTLTAITNFAYDLTLPELRDTSQEENRCPLSASAPATPWNVIRVLSDSVSVVDPPLLVAWARTLAASDDP
jgi:hypothetical protein